MMQGVNTTLAEVPADWGTPSTAFAWATSTMSSSSNPVARVLASSVVTIPMTVPLTKIPKVAPGSSPETTSIVHKYIGVKQLNQSQA